MIHYTSTAVLVYPPFYRGYHQWIHADSTDVYTGGTTLSCYTPARSKVPPFPQGDDASARADEATHFFFAAAFFAVRARRSHQSLGGVTPAYRRQSSSRCDRACWVSSWPPSLSSRQPSLRPARAVHTLSPARGIRIGGSGQHYLISDITSG